MNYVDFSKLIYCLSQQQYIQVEYSCKITGGQIDHIDSIYSDQIDHDRITFIIKNLDIESIYYLVSILNDNNDIYKFIKNKR